MLDGVEHRLEVAEVRRRSHDLGGDHDLLLVADRLRVVALVWPRIVLTRRESGSVTLIFAAGVSGGT